MGRGELTNKDAGAFREPFPLGLGRVLLLVDLELVPELADGRGREVAGRRISIGGHAVALGVAGAAKGSRRRGGKRRDAFIGRIGALGRAGARGDIGASGLERVVRGGECGHAVGKRGLRGERRGERYG